MVRFDPLDHLILGLFLAAILVLGFSARLRDAGMLQYLAAGRSLTLAPFVATLVCTWYGGILGVGESVSFYGLGAWVLLGVPYYVFALVYAFALARRVRGSEEISIPERLGSQFGPSAKWVGALGIFLLAVPSAHVLMIGILLQMVTGWTLTLSVGVAATVGVLFLYRGGLLADVRASLLAFVMMYVGFAVMVTTCVTQHPNALEPLRQLPTWSLTGGQAWTTLVGFFLLGAWTLVDPGFHQRVASAESPEVGRRGVLVGVGFWVLFDALTITTGLYALALLPEAPPNPLMIFPALAEVVLPPGLKAVFFAGMLGTLLSALVGYALVAGSTLGRDLLAPWMGITDEARVKGLTRAGTGVAALLAVALALQMQSVVQIWYAWGGVVVGALLLPVLASYGLIRVAPGAVPWAMGLGLAVAMSAWVAGTSLGNPYLSVSWAGHSFDLGTLLPGLAVSGFVLAWGGWRWKIKPQ